jgi:aminoglycoside phosphotransferase (APT) family kinase protein
MPLRHYSPAEITINFAGLDLNKGAGTDEFVSIEEDEDFFSITKGVDGEVTRNEMPNNTLMCTVTLMASSDTNDKLSAIHELDRKQRGGAGVAPFLYRNRLGTDLVVAAEAFITKRPTRTRAKAVGTVQWVFQVCFPENFNGS